MDPLEANVTYENHTMPSCFISARVQFSIGLAISIIGIIANIAFMYVVGQVRTMRTVLNAYLVNLAVADLDHLMWHCYIWINYFIGGPQSLTHQEYCALMFFSRLSQYVSLFTVAVLSIERYLAMCRPMVYRNSFIHKGRVIAFIIFNLWFLSSLLSIESVVDCVSTTDRRAMVGRIIFLLSVFSLVIVVFVMYSLVIMAAKNSTHSAVARRKERQIVRVCLATAVTHFACCLPVVIQTTALVIQESYAGALAITHPALCLNNISTFALEINSAANPFIYNILSSTYRQAFKSAFCRCIKNRAIETREDTNMKHYSTARMITTTRCSADGQQNSKDDAKSECTKAML